MAYATYIITVPLTLYAIYFALVNPGDVKVEFWPLTPGMPVPVNVLGLGMLGAGFLLGALFVWLQYQKLRLRHWQETRKTARLEKELETLRRQKEAENDAKGGDAASQTLPAIAGK